MNKPVKPVQPTGSASRLQSVSPSGLREFFELGAKLAAKGVDVISLGLGDLDLPLPPFVGDAIANAFATGQTHYSSNAGIIELRSAIANRYKETFKLDYSTDEVLVTCGALEALFDTMLAFLNPGDRVLIQDPAFGSFANQAKLAGAQLDLVPMTAEFDLDVDKFAKALDAKPTRMLIINSPCNPTGSVASRANIRAIVELARVHHCILVSDECYEFLRYDGQKHTCAAEFGRDNVIVINSFSKVLAMTGLRLGYLVAPAPLLRPIYQVHQYNTACAAMPVQVGAAKTLTNTLAFRGIVDQHRNVLNERRKVAIECFKEIPGLTLDYTPLAGFYLFPSVQGTGMTGTKFAQTTLEKAGVIVVPGNEFGTAFPNHVRISFGATPPNRIREATARIKRVLDPHG